MMDIEKLEKLNELKEKGILSEEEFNIQKKMILEKKDNNLPNKSASTNDDKSLWKYFVECLTKKYCSFKGRARRKEYFGYMLFRFIFGSLSGAVLGGILGGILGYHMGLEGVYIGGQITNFILILFFLLPDSGVWVRRCHDAGYSAWWPICLLVISIPVVAMIEAIVNYDTYNSSATNIVKFILFSVPLFIPAVFIFLKSEEKENKYGPVPEGVLK